MTEVMLIDGCNTGVPTSIRECDGAVEGLSGYDMEFASSGRPQYEWNGPRGREDACVHAILERGLHFG